MSTSDSSTARLAFLKSIETNLYRIGGPLLIIFGTIGCLITLFIFKEKNLRKHPCTIYFLAFNCSNFALIYSSLLAVMLELGFNINPSAYSLVCCRLRLYTLLLFDCLSSFYLILISMDRMLVTSINATTRRRSSRTFAYKCVIIGTIFWVLFNSHALFLTERIRISATAFTCYFRPGSYVTFIAFYSLTKSILMPLCMITFGIQTIRNIRSIRRINILHTITASTNTNTFAILSSRDSKLIRTVWIHICIYVVFSLTMTSFLLYDQFTQYRIKDNVQKQADLLWRYIGTFGIYMRYCLCGYVNLLVSDTVRQRIRNCFFWKPIIIQPMSLTR